MPARKATRAKARSAPTGAVPGSKAGPGSKARGPARAPLGRRAPRGLAGIQGWLLAEIVRPVEGGPADAAPADRVVVPSATLTAAERVALYQDSYYLRLKGCLASDFPGVKAILGDDRFDRLCQSYLRAFPPRDYTLNPLSWDMPRHLGGLGAGARRQHGLTAAEHALVLDVATLEVAISRVFDAELPRPITAAALAAIPPERWPEARVRFIDALEVYAFDHAANAIVTAARQERPLPDLGPQRTWCAIYRKEYAVLRVDMPEARHALLTALRGGATLAAGLERAAEAFGEGGDLEARIFRWLEDWVADGLFAEVIV